MWAVKSQLCDPMRTSFSRKQYACMEQTSKKINGYLFWKWLFSSNPITLLWTSIGPTRDFVSTEDEKSIFWFNTHACFVIHLTSKLNLIKQDTQPQEFVFIFQTAKQNKTPKQKVRWNTEREALKQQLNALFSKKINFQNTCNVLCFCIMGNLH